MLACDERGSHRALHLPDAVRMEPYRTSASPLRLPAALLLLAIACTAQADVVRLKNGDRLSGTVVSKHDNTLVLRTPYAGEVRIAWHEVAELVVDQPVQLMLADEPPSAATLVPAGPGQAAVVRDGALPEPVELARIAYINPRPYQSGTGVAWRGHVNVAATFTRGNATNDQFYGDAQLQARAKDYRWIVGAKVNRVRDGADNALNSWLGDGSLDRFIRPRHFVYARSSLEHDLTKDLELRAALGAGYGWQLAETPDRQLSLRGGLDYVHVDRSAGDDEQYPALGWGLRYEQWLVSRKLQLFQEQEGFWNTRELDDIVLRTKTGVRVPLYTNIDATAQLNLDWDSAPAPGRETLDSVWLLGLGYKF
jgi:putative salt-induced outer membrane protein YdiY